MADEPVIIEPKKGPKPSSITMFELTEAVVNFLIREHDVQYDSWDFCDHDYGTDISIYVIHDGSKKCLKFSIDDVRARSANARLGPLPREVRIEHEHKVFADIVAEPLPKKAIAFHKVKRREGGSVYY